MKRRSLRRGLTLVEVLFVMGIMGAVMAVVMGIMANSSRSFAREQGQTYTQFRVRTAVDEMAKEVRAAASVVPSTGLPSNTGAITIRVPCRSNTGIVYSASPPSAQNMVLDTVSYYVSNGVLSRKITVGHASSVRPAGTVVVAQDVSALTFQMKTSTGAGTTDVAQAAEVDLSATVGGGAGMEPRTVALTGVRLRNYRPPTS